MQKADLRQGIQGGFESASVAIDCGGLVPLSYYTLFRGCLLPWLPDGRSQPPEHI